MIEKPIAKITASIMLIGVLGSYFMLVWNEIAMPAEGFALIGGLAGGAATYLFMSDKMQPESIQIKELESKNKELRLKLELSQKENKIG